MTPFSPGQTIAGKYVLAEPLGLGSLGPVWIARHATLGVDLALAFLAPDRAAQPEARASFEQDARSFALVKSPHVLEVHDYGVEGDTPFVVLDALQGEELAARLAREKRLSLGDALPLVTAIGKGLFAIHEAGVVHGEVRPENVFLAKRATGEIPKVLSFGIGKVLRGAPSAATIRVDLPLYESPEQARGAEEIDLRSDLWSFGIIIFELLTGRVPFPAEEATEARLLITADPVPAPSRMQPDLGPEVDAFFERALAREPERRFQSAIEMVDAFAALSAPRVEDPRSSAPPAIAPPVEAPPNEIATPAEARPSAPPPAPGEPWTPIHPKKSDPRNAIIAALVVAVLAVVAVLIVVLAKPAPLLEQDASQAAGPLPKVAEDPGEGPIFVPFVPATTEALAPPEPSPKLGGPWPKSSAAPSASAAAAAPGSAGDEDAGATRPAPAPPPRSTSIFGF